VKMGREEVGPRPDPSFDELTREWVPEKTE
jgi:hypothetical protein